MGALRDEILMDYYYDNNDEGSKYNDADILDWFENLSVQQRANIYEAMDGDTPSSASGSSKKCNPYSPTHRNYRKIPADVPKKCEDEFYCAPSLTADLIGTCKPRAKDNDNCAKH